MKPDRFPGVFRKRRMLVAIDLEIENRIVLARERAATADPACGDVNEAGRHHAADASAISRAISSQLRVLSCAPKARVRRVNSSGSARQRRNLAHTSAALSTSSISNANRSRGKRSAMPAALDTIEGTPEQMASCTARPYAS